jgi:predicted ATPase
MNQPTDTELLDYMTQHPVYVLQFQPSSATWTYFDGLPSSEHTEAIGRGRTPREAITAAILHPYRKEQGK